MSKATGVTFTVLGTNSLEAGTGTVADVARASLPRASVR